MHLSDLGFNFFYRRLSNKYVLYVYVLFCLAIHLSVDSQVAYILVVMNGTTVNTGCRYCFEIQILVLSVYTQSGIAVSKYIFYCFNYKLKFIL